MAGGWPRGVGAPLCSGDLDVAVIVEGPRGEGTGIVGGAELDERYLLINTCNCLFSEFGDTKCPAWLSISLLIEYFQAIASRTGRNTR